MKIKILGPDNFVETQWSGGKTRQLIIYPENSNLSKRDFEFRISSASFTGEESDFSDFTGYQRYILPLKGDLYLDHKGLYQRQLAPYDVEYFDGSFKTYSKNSLDCIDFNFIVKNGKGHILQILKEDTKISTEENTMVLIYSEAEYKIVSDSIRTIEKDRLTVIEASDNEEINIEVGDKPIIYCVYKK